MKSLISAVLLFILLILFGCAPTEETTDSRYDEKSKVENKDTQTDEIYIFEDTEEDEPVVVKPKKEEYIFDDQDVSVDNKNVLSSNNYYVQLGAFSKEDGAKVYVEVNQSYAQTPLNITYDSERGLYLVRSKPLNSRQEAENLRNELKKQERFKDVFLVAPK
ncbi:MAG: SPOR domain-containing protein [Ignavibacteriales bacterium]|nr:SPOR domain-containing protein [Ignavibacteriales bacterium]